MNEADPEQTEKRRYGGESQGTQLSPQRTV